GSPVEIKISRRIARANFGVFVHADIRADLECVPPPYLRKIGKELQAGEPLDRSALGAECLESRDVEYRQVQVVRGSGYVRRHSQSSGRIESGARQRAADITSVDGEASLQRHGRSTRLDVVK